MKNLREVRKFLAEIPAINSGGCAIAALAMKRWLKTHKNRGSKIIYRYSWEDDYSYMRNQLLVTNKRKRILPHSCNHAYLKYRNREYDAFTDEVNPYYEVSLSMPENLVVKSLNREGQWNPCFDRKWIVKIEEKLAIDLSDVSVF